MIIHGDCLEILPTLTELFDSCVCDPPYHLQSIVKRFGKPGSAPAQEGTDGRFTRASKGFMGKSWDGGDVASNPETWAKVLDVLKPGAHLVAFSGTRTYHRMACAIEDAGFEIRNQLAWTYGQGFPKSHTVALEGWDDWGTDLKPAWEPICLARKPLSEKTVAANVERWGTGAINIEGCRVGEIDGRWPANLIHDGSIEVENAFPQAKGQQGALSGKEPSSKTNSVYGEYEGRSPSTPRGDSGSAARFFYCAKASSMDRVYKCKICGLRGLRQPDCDCLGKDHKRNLDSHPTVKPTELMRWLCRLVTPPLGRVLDPFCGSGTTLTAAKLEGFSPTGIEMDSEYCEDAKFRLTIFTE